MKNLFMFLFAVLIITACTSKKEETTEAEAQEWPEMDAYHLVMAEAFHPFKDSANLEPVKAQAAELAKAAEAWMNAPLPEKVDNDEVKAKLAELKTNSDALAQLVAKGTTEEIGAALTTLHDQFHALQEAWYGGEGHHHHSH